MVDVEREPFVPWVLESKEETIWSSTDRLKKQLKKVSYDIGKKQIYELERSNLYRVKEYIYI